MFVTFFDSGSLLDGGVVTLPVYYFTRDNTLCQTAFLLNGAYKQDQFGSMSFPKDAAFPGQISVTLSFPDNTTSPG